MIVPMHSSRGRSSTQLRQQYVEAFAEVLDAEDANTTPHHPAPTVERAAPDAGRGAQDHFEGASLARLPMCGVIWLPGARTPHLRREGTPRSRFGFASLPTRTRSAKRLNLLSEALPSWEGLLFKSHLWRTSLASYSHPVVVAPVGHLLGGKRRSMGQNRFTASPNPSRCGSLFRGSFAWRGAAIGAQFLRRLYSAGRPA